MVSILASLPKVEINRNPPKAIMNITPIIIIVFFLGRFIFFLIPLILLGFDVSTNGFSTLGTEDKTTNQEHGIADASDSVPADLSVDGIGTVGFFSACDSGIVGDTYLQTTEQRFYDERFIIGDSGGFIYKVDETYVTDNNISIDSRHLTPVVDAGMPGNYKRWPGIKVTAKGTRFIVRSRIGNFDSSDTGWSDISQELTSEWINYEFPLNITSKKIQWEIKDLSGQNYSVSDMEILQPTIEDNR